MFVLAFVWINDVLAWLSLKQCYSLHGVHVVSSSELARKVSAYPVMHVCFYWLIWMQVSWTNIYSVCELTLVYIYFDLTRLPLDKMATISLTTFSCAFSWMKVLYFDSNCTEVCSQGSSSKQALVHVMAWHRTGDKALSEPMLTQFTDAYMRH